MRKLRELEVDLLQKVAKRNGKRFRNDFQVAFNRDGNFTTAVLCNTKTSKIKTGVSKRNPNDVPMQEVGDAVALKRAYLA